jgi:NAD(P)-dependent dehydrogenase (short-subunit alcohol dehydrogenase family)
MLPNHAMHDYEPVPDLLHGRIVLVTGAADTLGRAVATACAYHGATVVLSDLKPADLETAYDALESAGCPQPAILPLDLEQAKEADFIAAADTLGREFGRLDGLAHCAAFAPFLSRIDDYDPAEWERVLRINLSAPFLLTQACLPLLRAAPDPSVVFTADRVGRRGLAYWGAFAAAKFGVEGLMQTLADELRDSSPIRVNSLDPGIVQSGLRTRLYPGEDPRRWPPAEDVTPSYLYLLGPDARGVSGQALSAQP